MRTHTPEMLEAIRAGVLKRSKVADLYYGLERRVRDVPLIDPQFTWSGDAQIQGSGSVKVVWQGDFGESIVPRRIRDDFAPFGATLFVRDVFQVGAARWEVPIGWFPIVDVPSAWDTRALWRGRPITVGSVVELTLQDRMARVKSHRFEVPTTPLVVGSALDEAARITGLQITKTVPDAPIKGAVVYQEDRLEALYDLCRVVLDAVPQMEPDGSMSFRPIEWPEPVDRVVYGPTADGQDGSVRSIGEAMSSDGVVNYIAVRTAGTENASILYRTWVASGPLRAFEPDGSEGPAGIRDEFLSSQQVTTYQQAQEWADRELARKSRLAAKSVPIVLGYNSLYQVGDVLEVVNGWDGSVMLCRLTEVRQPPAPSPTMQITVEVAGG